MKKGFVLLLAVTFVVNMMAVPTHPKQLVLGKQKVQGKAEVMASKARNDYQLTERMRRSSSAKSSYSFDFTQGQHNWTIDNVNIPTDLSFVWQQNSTYGMKASAYNKKAYASESWLISTDIDLSEYADATLSVNQAVNQGASTNLKAKISDDGGKTWEDLALNKPAGTNWTFQTDEVSLDDYVGNIVKIAFVYVSTTEVCPAWEVKTVDITSKTSGDTIKVDDVDTLRIGYYPSYSSEGAYNYTFALYNSEDENYVPALVLDIYTEQEKAFTGTYSMEDSTMTEYSYYIYGSGDEDYIEITDGEVTITDNGEGNYTIKGWFTDGDTIYSVDKTVDGECYNADYQYEPETQSTFNLTITDGEEDNTYAEDYRFIDIYLTTDEGNAIQLEYMLCESDATAGIADGTYPIENTEYDEEGSVIEKAYGYFGAGYFFSSFGMPMASYYATSDAYYYLVSGTVQIETVEDGKKVTLSGTTYYGSTINAVYTLSPEAALQTIQVDEAGNGKYLIDGQMYILRQGRLYNAQGAVVE